MNSFAANILGTQVNQDEVAVFWAGQAGFVIKTDDGRLLALDLYLSDCCERNFGFKRIAPYMLEPHELQFDYILASHGHYDHFDIDAIPMMLHGNTQFIGATDTKVECDRLGLTQNTNFIACNDEIDLGGISIKGVPCDHGDLAPEALGLFITIGNKKIYYVGDSAFRTDYFRNGELQGADLLILPINGKFGNMNGSEAALAAELLQPKLSVPCHYWNFAEHGGNPDEFAEEMKKKSLAFSVLRIGEGIKI